MIGFLLIFSGASITIAVLIFFLLGVVINWFRENLLKGQLILQFFPLYPLSHKRLYGM